MKSKGCLRIFLRGIAAVFALCTVLILLGFSWQQSAERADDERYPPQGTLYEIEGRTLHMYCEGDGDPAVILDSGLGGWSIDFAELQPILAERGRTCSYDRAGYGWSDFAEGERDTQMMADDLLALLDAADITDPVVLVGFSFSGLHTRLLALQHPDRVEGLILLDPALETDNDLYSDELLQQQQSLPAMYNFFGLLSEAGIVRLLNPEEMAPYAPFISQGQTERYYTEVAKPAWWYVSGQEFSMMITGESASILENAGTLPDTLPVVVIGIDTYPDEMPASIPVQREQNLRNLAEESRPGVYWTAEGVLHEDLIDQSSLIVQALEWVTNPDVAVNQNS
jgi:pimeloyl-ACP methyl ester carboxylesterase